MNDKIDYLNLILWVFFAISLVILLITFIVPKYLPIQDGWSHDFTLFCLRYYEHWRDLLKVNYLPYAGWVTPFTLYPFVSMLGFVAGLKFYVITMIFILFLIYKKFIDVFMNDRSSVLTWAISMLVSLNLFLIKGFFSFIVGLIVFLFFLGMIGDGKSKNPTKWFAILTLVEIFIHPFYVAEGLLLVFWSIYYKKLYRWISLKKIMCIVFFVILLMIPFSSYIKHVFGVKWTVSIIERLRVVLTGGYIFPWYFSKSLGLFFLLYIQFFVVGMLFLTFWFTFINRWYVLEDSYHFNEVIVSTALTNFILYFVIFDIFGTGSYIHTRQMFIGMILIVPLVLREIKERYGKFFVKGFKVYFVLMWMFEVIIINEKFYFYSNKFNSIIQNISDKIESNVNFICVVNDRYDGGYAYPLQHIGGLIGILKHSFYINNLDFLNSYRPLKLKLSAKVRKSLLNPHSCSNLIKYAPQYFDYILIVNVKNKKNRLLYEECKYFNFLDSIYKDDEIILLKKRLKK